MVYTTFSSFFIRVPCFPFNSLNEEPFEKSIQNPHFQEAVFVASPILYAELQKYLSGLITDNAGKQRIESTLYRYISRMSSRCNPFGLFASCSIGNIIGDTTSITLGNTSRTTRLDMYFLCTLSQELSKIPEIKKKMIYYIIIDIIIKILNGINSKIKTIGK